MSIFKKAGSLIGTAVGSVASATEYGYRTLVRKEDACTAKANANNTKLLMSKKVGEAAGEVLELVGPIVTSTLTSHLTGKMLGKGASIKRLK